MPLRIEQSMATVAEFSPIWLCKCRMLRRFEELGQIGRLEKVNDPAAPSLLGFPAERHGPPFGCRCKERPWSRDRHPKPGAS